MKVGFTGSQREKMPHEQFDSLVELINLLTEIEEAHHGDCIGADAIFHAIVKELQPDATIHVHPPHISDKRAFCDGDVIHEQYPYLMRNHHIVDDSDIMIACPKEKKEVLRSGTWATVRYTRKKNKPLIFVWSDGKYEYEDKSTREPEAFGKDEKEEAFQELFRR